MVENAPTPVETSGPFRPFQRPSAPVALGLTIRVGAAEIGAGMYGGATFRLYARIDNEGRDVAQVDRARFRATLASEPLRAVDNATARPLTAWVDGMFYCMRDLPGIHALPDHVVLRPGESIAGELCWVAERYRRGAADVDVSYGDPSVFRASVHATEGFMGVYLPPKP
jgi:hypothetical protein